MGGLKYAPLAKEIPGTRRMAVSLPISIKS